jgi:hypothetical protein
MTPLLISNARHQHATVCLTHGINVVPYPVAALAWSNASMLHATRPCSVPSTEPVRQLALGPTIGLMTVCIVARRKRSSHHKLANTGVSPNPAAMMYQIEVQSGADKHVWWQLHSCSPVAARFLCPIKHSVVAAVDAACRSSFVLLQFAPRLTLIIYAPCATCRQLWGSAGQHTAGVQRQCRSKRRCCFWGHGLTGQSLSRTDGTDCSRPRAVTQVEYHLFLEPLAGSTKYLVDD